MVVEIKSYSSRHSVLAFTKRFLFHARQARFASGTHVLAEALQVDCTLSDSRAAHFLNLESPRCTGPELILHNLSPRPSSNEWLGASREARRGRVLAEALEVDLCVEVFHACAAAPVCWPFPRTCRKVHGSLADKGGFPRTVVPRAQENATP
jgi:hypothetical protein